MADRSRVVIRARPLDQLPQHLIVLRIAQDQGEGIMKTCQRGERHHRLEAYMLGKHILYIRGERTEEACQIPDTACFQADGVLDSRFRLILPATDQPLFQ